MDHASLIKTLRAQLSGSKLSGFEQRARLLFLAFLREVPHERVERTVHQATFFGRLPLEKWVQATLCRKGDPQALLPKDDFPLEAFRAWCGGLRGRVKPWAPHKARPRPTRARVDSGAHVAPAEVAAPALEAVS